MRPNLFEIKYFETYYFANVINNVLTNPFGYLRSLEEYFGEDNYVGFIKPFPKPSIFHSFIGWMIDNISSEDISSLDIVSIREGKELWIDIAIKHYNIDDYSFRHFLTNIGKDASEADDDDIYDYFQDLRICQIYDDLLDKMSEEIFFILFLNRALLQKFNELVAHRILEHTTEDSATEVNRYFKKDGVLKRVTIPTWVQRAVLHRDRGMCTSCKKDISGLINIASSENFDHIIPLAIGGANDVTNIQLLCETCNKAKSKKHVITSSYYEKWF